MVGIVVCRLWEQVFSVMGVWIFKRAMCSLSMLIYKYTILLYIRQLYSHTFSHFSQYYSFDGCESAELCYASSWSWLHMRVESLESVSPHWWVWVTVISFFFLLFTSIFCILPFLFSSIFYHFLIFSQTNLKWKASNPILNILHICPLFRTNAHDFLPMPLHHISEQSQASHLPRHPSSLSACIQES